MPADPTSTALRKALKAEMVRRVKDTLPSDLETVDVFTPAQRDRLALLYDKAIHNLELMIHELLAEMEDEVIGTVEAMK